MPDTSTSSADAFRLRLLARAVPRLVEDCAGYRQEARRQRRGRRGVAKASGCRCRCARARSRTSSATATSRSASRSTSASGAAMPAPPISRAPRSSRRCAPPTTSPASPPRTRPPACPTTPTWPTRDAAGARPRSLPSLGRSTPRRRSSIARRCEAAALAVDRRITNSEGAGVSAQQSHFFAGNTRGFRRRLCELAPFALGRADRVVPGSGDDMQRDAWYSSMRDRPPSWPRPRRSAATPPSVRCRA